MTKSIEQLSERVLKQKLQEINSLQEIDASTLEVRTRIEKRLYELSITKHPPVHTPSNFIERDEEW